MHKILIIALFMCCNYIIVAQNFNSKIEIVGQVNGEPVTSKEYAFFAQRNRHKVISKFRNEYKLNYHADFWQDKSKGKTPGEVLREITIDDIVNSKVQFLLAKHYGIINDISFESIQKHLDAENLLRQNALNNNVVIYGPEQYTIESYYEYLTANMVIKLKDYLLKNNIIEVDLSKGISDKNTSTMHDDDEYYSKVHIANTQINNQYNEIVKQLIMNAVIKFD